MKRTILNLVGIICILPTTEAKEQKYISLNDVNCYYSFDNDKLNGEYSSYYSNGRIRCIGQFKDNNRIGNWKLFDSIGNLLVERIYKSSNQFTQVFPSSYLIPVDLAQRMTSSESVIIYKHIYETVDLHKSLNSNIFINSILEAYKSDKIKKYSDDRFAFEDASSQLIEGEKIVQLQIKRAAFIENQNCALQNKIVGIQLVSDIKGELKSHGWLYFPDLKSSTEIGIYFDIESGNYSSAITKVINLKSLHNSEQVRVDDKYIGNNYQFISLIEKEHEVWQEYLTSKQLD